MIATTEEKTEKLRPWLDEFASFHGQAHGPAWLQDLRARGFARFHEMGFPTTKDEDWRFTSLQPISNTEFRLAGEHRVGALGEGLMGLPKGACARLVFVDGRYVPSLSSVDNLPKGVIVTDLKTASEADSSGVERHLAQYESLDGDAFTALNTAFLSDGAYVHVARGTTLEQPLYLLYVSTASPTTQMTHPRNLIVVEDDAQVAVVEDYATMGDQSAQKIMALTNAVTELVVGDNGVVSHYLVKREGAGMASISTLRIQQGRSANVVSHALLLGGGLVRNNVHPVLAGEGGECLVNGLFLGRGSQHLDNYIKVDHQAPHCQSRQFYNGILDDTSRGVFHGRIIVHKDAQKTDAKQTNRNLLLSDSAQIDTKPQLEIYADDVKCTHGATIGQIDDTALFYLRSRGLPEREARALLLYAFAHENLDRMKPAVVREWLSELVSEHLPTGAAASLIGAVRERSWQEVG